MENTARTCPRCSNQSWHEEKPFVVADPTTDLGIPHARQVILACDACGWKNAAFVSLYPKPMKPFNPIEAAQKIISKK